MVILGTILFLSLIGFTLLPKAKRINASKVCQGNLRELHFALIMWPQSGPAEPPWQSPYGTQKLTNSGMVSPHFRALTNELKNLRCLVCPGDDRLAAKSWSEFSDSNISYFINLDSTESKPSRICLGDRGIRSSAQTTNQMFIVSSNATYEWKPLIHNQRGSIVRSDGSVSAQNNAGINTELSQPVNKGNRIQLPK